MANFLNQVPQAPQTLGVTQPLILQNFQTIDAAFQVDHVPYTTPGQGKHNQVTFPVQAMAPTFTGTDSGLYSTMDSFSGVTQIFVVPPGPVSPGTPVPMTAASLTTQGYSYLPSGLLMQWGQSTVSGGGTTPVVFPKAFPNAVLNIMVCPVSVNTPVGNFISVNSMNITTTGFQILNGNTGVNKTANWIALGN